MPNLGRYLFMWIIIALLLIGAFNMFENPQQDPKSLVDYTTFLEDVQAGNVQEVVVKQDIIVGMLKDGGTFSTLNPGDTKAIERLIDNGVRVRAKAEGEGKSAILSILISWFPILLFIGVWIFFMRQMGGGGAGKAMGFGKSKAKLLTEKHGRVMFEDVAGVDEAKQELEEVVDFLKDPQKFQRLGGKIPKGALLVGPPGTGKTLLARAVAGEAGVPFFTIAGSDFVEMFVGVGASRVRDMFEQGKKNAPCIIFIDEIDAVGGKRGSGQFGGGHDEREQTLNQLLVEMDGFESSEGVILLAATNRPDVLDPALLRPGRFDRQVTVPNPDVGGREKILRVHLKKVPMDSDVNVKALARGTPGFSGAELANVVNEAALLAARLNRKTVSMEELEQAKDKVMMGAERRSMAMSDDEKKLTAYHEAGHAIVLLKTEHSDPIHKATIIPRGQALGMVMHLPENDNHSVSKAKYIDMIRVAYGGRIAEEMIFGKEMVTGGAYSDIKQATNVARSMVSSIGMSDKVGKVDVSDRRYIAEDTLRDVDEEVKRILDECYADVEKILTEHKGELEKLAQAMLEYETLTGDEINDLLYGDGIKRDDINRPNYKAPEVSTEKKKAKSSVPTTDEDKE